MLLLTNKGVYGNQSMLLLTIAELQHLMDDIGIVFLDSHFLKDCLHNSCIFGSSGSISPVFSHSS